ncbi:hypothetical protein HY373_02390 [Candidatus Berkelbacteria bacterium]|nr:hypothetical protein [Candidatus Berkelbacteria bacterium]MBI2588432.1 hypothetical protein [Candidatus Berkelbacteria bacterium]MBI4030004.1 hypothetical protein [Candidatus Berkelbacteria bacterium]
MTEISDPVQWFMNLSETIICSAEMLKLEENWDGRGGKSISKDTWLRAISLLSSIAWKIWQEQNIQIAVPDIAPVPDGSVDLDWKPENYELLINIPADPQKPPTYYGDDLKGSNVIKGELDTSEALDWLLPYVFGQVGEA